ncbi:DDE-type integrase/transposase/recombinase [Microvirga makkahensis]|uniref:DDE-type integrase/transposase/recombinase n=1 Tax=Microvirga makkahensis TaxID=1128670 RepID=A0A7X3MSB1_9HYPH|nr:DDE-type integrase/transposase/recombinase [Microvirga makkahensis]
MQVGGRWKYLFRAAERHKQLIDPIPSDRCNAGAPYRLLRKAVKTMSDYPPSSIMIDKLGSCPRGRPGLWREGCCRRMSCTNIEGLEQHR